MISFGSAIVQWFRLHLPSYKSGVQIPSHLCIFHGLKYQYYYLSFEFVIELWEWTLPLNLKTYGIKLLWNLFFKNGPTPASFVYFRSFQTNIVTIFTTNKCEKCPSSIWCRDSNSQPSDYESPLLTTRPGLPPKMLIILSAGLILLLLTLKHLGKSGHTCLSAVTRKCVLKSTNWSKYIYWLKKL